MVNSFVTVKPVGAIYSFTDAIQDEEQVKSKVLVSFKGDTRNKEPTYTGLQPKFENY